MDRSTAQDDSLITIFWIIIIEEEFRKFGDSMQIKNERMEGMCHFDFAKSEIEICEIRDVFLKIRRADSSPRDCGDSE